MPIRRTRARNVRRFILAKQQQGYVLAYTDYRLLTRYVLGELTSEEVFALSETTLFAICHAAHQLATYAHQLEPAPRSS